MRKSLRLTHLPPAFLQEGESVWNLVKGFQVPECQGGQCL